ncbi:norsolorinic acid reductase [Aspergillus flavus]|nr:norsolorinic acid reductase [Aspergillus flavus]
MISHIAFFFASVLAASLGISVNVNSSNLREVYQFPHGTWVENIAVRSNGNLLVTLVNVPEVWEVFPSAQAGASGARLVHHFTNEGMSTSITEHSPDMFALITPNTVWKMHLDAGREASPVRVATLPAGNLNGMATLDQELGRVAISDSESGLVLVVIHILERSRSSSGTKPHGEYEGRPISSI